MAATNKRKRAHARTMAPAKQSTVAIFRNNQRLYHGTGENRRIVRKDHKMPKCSNGYRQKGWCDSRPNWHTLTTLISRAKCRNPHRRASVITFRIGKASHRNLYRHGVTIGDWHKYRCTISSAYMTDRSGLSVRAYYHAAMRIQRYRHMSICGWAHNENGSHYHSHAGKIDQEP